MTRVLMNWTNRGRLIRKQLILLWWRMQSCETGLHLEIPVY
jgi:hypothetical protein